jgi:peptidyl-prolyl cis-trans isomerase D
MFDFFRNNIKFLMGFLMLLIIPSFVMFGVDNYSRFSEKGEAVAKVGKSEITRQEWDNAHRAEVDRAQASMPRLDRALLDTPEARQRTLDNMIDERVLSLAAQDMHFVTSDQRLARALSVDPNIASLRRADGTLDMSRYKDLLRAQGMTPEMFENSVRADLARRQVGLGVAASGFLPAGAAQPVLRAYFEQREVQLAHFQPKDYRTVVQVTDAEVQSYYEAHTQEFKTTEQIDVEFVVLDLEAVARNIRLSESDLKAYYEQNNAKLAQNEQRRASHILLTVPAGATADAKAKVKAQADALLTELRKAPQRFAELAKANSQDPGSAARGGDLDFFARGTMVKPFEEAAFALQKNQISDVVESEFGFHIILLTDVRTQKPEPFEAVRAKLEVELKKQQAQRRFAEAAEDFGNLVYEQSDTLAPAAAKFGLKVDTAKGLLRTGPAQGNGVSALATPKLLERLFSEDSLRQKRNTEAVEAGANQMVSARVLAHRPAEVRALKEVKELVRERLLLQKATEKAKAEGAAQLAAWKIAPANAKLNPVQTISRNAVRQLPVSVVAAAFTAPVADKEAAWVGVDLGADGYMVVRVNRVLDRVEPSADQAKQEREQLGQIWTQAEAQAYMGHLRKHFNTKVLSNSLGDEKK